MGRISARCGPLSRSVFLGWLLSSPSHAQHEAVGCHAKLRNRVEATPLAASISRPLWPESGDHLTLSGAEGGIVGALTIECYLMRAFWRQTKTQNVGTDFEKIIAHY
jgi:hypothetical protein